MAEFLSTLWAGAGYRVRPHLRFDTVAGLAVKMRAARHQPNRSQYGWLDAQIIQGLWDRGKAEDQEQCNKSSKPPKGDRSERVSCVV